MSEGNISVVRHSRRREWMPEHDNIIEFHASCAMLRRVGLLERVSAIHISPPFYIFLLSTQAALSLAESSKSQPNSIIE